MEKFQFLALVTLFTQTLGFQPDAQAQETLDANVIAQLSVSNGYVSPKMDAINGVRVLDDGSVEYFHGDLTKSKLSFERVLVLDHSRLEAIQKQIIGISKGKLVDVNANEPSGADFPTRNYDIRRSAKTISIAERRGDGHLHILKQNEVYKLKEILDAFLIISGSSLTE